MNDCGHLVMTEISLIEFFDFFFNRVCIEKNYTRVMSLHRGPENFKKSTPKKLMKSNKKIFKPKSVFCNFKNGQKLIFKVGKVFHQN